MKQIDIKKMHIIVLLFVALNVGCTKNLEENPTSIISPVNFYVNDADFNAAINGAISPLYNGQTSAYTTLLICAGAEDVTSRPTAPELLECDKLKPTITWGRISGTWTNYYKCINSCNAIISTIGKASQVSDANKPLIEGQARYIRALSYFYLVRWFGEIPIMTTENQLDAANVVQSPVAEIYKQIVTDLTFAESNLPLTFADKVRPTKGAAKALLAEVYLNMAGWPLKDVSKYTLARDKAKEVMDLQLYDLEPKIADLWKVKNKVTSKEFIFIFSGTSSNPALGTSLHERSRPAEEAGWQDFMSEARFFNAFPSGPRKDASFWTVFADAKHTTWQNSQVQQPFIAKWRDGGTAATAEQGVVNTYTGDGFFPISRFADILLIYAEAANMAEGSPSATALEALNKIRRRAGGYDQAVYPDLLPGMSKQAFDDAVISERAWELAFEAKRWFDLVRKEMVVSANKDLYPYVDSHNLLLPKPQIELDLIKGLKQNPGY